MNSTFYFKDSYSSYPRDVTSPGPDQRAGSTKSAREALPTSRPAPVQPRPPHRDAVDQQPNKTK